MSKKRVLPSLIASIMIISQFGWVSVAAADHTPRVSPSPTPTESASPSPSVSPDPSPSPDPSVSPSPDPGASASPSPSNSPDPTPAPKNKKSTDVGPDGCGGTVPNWVFDVASQTWVAADKSTFSCDQARGYYLSPNYYFDKRIGWYEILPATTAAPVPTYMITAPNVVHTVLGDLQVGSQDYQVAQALGLLTSGAGGILAPAGGTSVDATTGSGTSAPTGIANGAPGQSVFDLTSLVNVINTLQSNATSGNVNATANTDVGNSSSGGATVVANLINLLASAWSWSNGNLSFFMQNLLAPQTGDITINPTQTVSGGGGSAGGTNVGVNGTGSGSNNTVDVNNPFGLTVNAKQSGNIVNNVDVNAQSGDSTASKNTVAGNVATGDANAQVNIINLINSFITSGDSFFGILNIIGNLNGDILFPAGFLDGLVPASGGAIGGGTTAGIADTGAGSNNQVGLDNSSAANINNASANAVNNNVLTSAGSGTANLNSNTSAGTAQTGAASTNQSIFNLANSSIFGDNAVLVMVNVMGHWLGKIMNLPSTGTSQSALLTGGASVGVNNTGANSNNQINVNSPTTTNANQQSAGTITNNVNVNAKSGNADATKNTKVGDVSSGSAKADSGIANIFNTMIGVKHWFGVLVINVFGDWIGDVNHDSAAGGFSTMPGSGSAQTRSGAGTSQSSPIPKLGLIAWVSPMPLATSADPVGSGTPSQTTVGSNDGKVLTASAHLAPIDTAAITKAKDMSLMFILSAVTMLIAGALITIDKKLARK